MSAMRLVVVGLLLCTLMHYSASAQAKVDVGEMEPIPAESPVSGELLKSWSLFLITNPDWIRSDSTERIEDLYSDYEAFGRSIGPDHLSIWLWKDASISTGAGGRVIDYDRAAAVCQLLRAYPKTP